MRTNASMLPMVNGFLTLERGAIKHKFVQTLYYFLFVNGYGRAHCYILFVVFLFFYLFFFARDLFYIARFWSGSVLIPSVIIVCKPHE